MLLKPTSGALDIKRIPFFSGAHEVRRILQKTVHWSALLWLKHLCTSHTGPDWEIDFLYWGCPDRQDALSSGCLGHRTVYHRGRWWTLHRLRIKLNIKKKLVQQQIKGGRKQTQRVFALHSQVFQVNSDIWFLRIGSLAFQGIEVL